MKDSISGILRQKRKPGKDGSSRDSARCSITLNGKRTFHYLGRYGSPEAEAEYNRLKAEFDKATASVSGQQFFDRSTTSGLFRAYRLTCLQGEQLTNDQKQDARAISYAEERFPPVSLEEFSMSYFVAYQSYLVRIAPEVRQAETVDRRGIAYTQKKAWSRQYVNRLVKSLKRIFTWGVNNGFVSPVFRESIRLFPGITAANPKGLQDSPKRDAVRDCDVIATLPYLTPVVANMVRIQRGACLRPSEVCDLRVGDITFSEEGTSTVSKSKNKIARTGVHRQIAFGYAETAILRKYCEGRSPSAHVFSLHEHVRYIVERARKHKGESHTYLQRYSESFSVDLYDKNVRRAVKRAMKDNPNIREWTPYQLRHASYSAISAQYGYDVASKVAGHLSPNLARVYDHSAAVVSQRIASERQHGWWEE